MSLRLKNIISLFICLLGVMELFSQEFDLYPGTLIVSYERHEFQCIYNEIIIKMNKGYTYPTSFLVEECLLPSVFCDSIVNVDTITYSDKNDISSRLDFVLYNVFNPNYRAIISEELSCILPDYHLDKNILYESGGIKDSMYVKIFYNNNPDFFVEKKEDMGSTNIYIHFLDKTLKVKVFREEIPLDRNSKLRTYLHGI